MPTVQCPLVWRQVPECPSDPRRQNTERVTATRAPASPAQAPLIPKPDCGSVHAGHRRAHLAPPDEPSACL